MESMNRPYAPLVRRFISCHIFGTQRRYAGMDYNNGDITVETTGGWSKESVRMSCLPVDLIQPRIKCLNYRSVVKKKKCFLAPFEVFSH